ncbi:MAG: DUF2452 domain-containing protein [Saprospiraceae bacterium]|nr:DUF2452 domain-containing protein [Saprospiraceae bacterium]
MKKQKEDFINPIDKDKITESPHILPYAHTVGGVVIKPIDRSKTKSLAIEAMHKQTNTQLEQIREQMELLAEQAKKIQNRIKISEIIYNAEMGFKPLIGKLYHLYQRTDETALLSVIGPNEWGKKGCPYNEFLATVSLLADHTWEIIR